MKKITLLSLCAVLSSTAVYAHENHQKPAMEANSPMAKMSPKRQKEFRQTIHQVMEKMTAEEREAFRQKIQKVMLKNDDNAPCQNKAEKKSENQ
ncbi:MAG: hypothetical protein IJ881_05270 [Neisseriaceae bacterium]|nr:hypothetical protein [Neisseriaceae bacterium]MBR3424800.1 hypothetical protein [Neisseriaceae bacterium]